MSKSFSIGFDSSRQGWVPIQMRVRMLSQDENGQYNPCSFSNPEFITEPAGWLSFSTSPEDDVICADVNVSDDFINEAGDDKFSNPIKVVIKALPDESSDSQDPITISCNVTVEEPGQNMGFSVEPNNLYKDEAIWLPADEKTICDLSVWVEVVDPQSGEVFRAPDEDYIFKYESTFEQDVLVCIDEDKGEIQPDSKWQNQKRIGQSDPIHGQITVKAYNKNKSLEKEVGKLEIPWVVYATNITMDTVFSPQLPALPGNEISASITLHQEGMDEPLADSDVQFVWADSCKDPLGEIVTETAKTDSAGVVELTYSAPDELIYEPGKKLFDEICILVGSGDNPIKLKKTIVIPVAPQVKLVGTAEKKGLTIDPDLQPIEILPEQLMGGKISGNLILPLEMEGGPLKKFGVNYAKLSIALDEDVAPTFEKHTGKRGYWNIELKEITQAWRKAHLRPKTTKLSVEPDNNQVFKMILDDEGEKEISDYENNLMDYNLHLYTAKFQRSLKFFRYHFCSQLATKNEDDYELAVSGVQLLTIAIRGTTAFFRRFKCQEDMVKTRLERVIGDLVNILFGIVNASKSIRSAGTSMGGWMRKRGEALLKWLADSMFGRWIAKGASWLADFATNIARKATEEIAPMVRSIHSGISTFLGELGEIGDDIARSLGSILDDFVSVIDDLVLAVSRKVESFTNSLSGSSEHWNELVEWVEKKKNSMTSTAEAASEWVSSVLSALQEMAESVMNLVAELFEYIGKLLFKALSGILAWCGEKAKTWLSSAVEWLCEHSDACKAKVEELMSKSMNNTEANENGIEKLIDAFLNGLFGELMSWSATKEAIELDMQDIKMKFNLLSRQPSYVVGQVYRYAALQYLPKDWEGERSDFIHKIVELSNYYHQYELTTVNIDMVTDIVSNLITVAGLGIALIGVVFSGGTAIAAVATGIAELENAFNMARAVMCDIPQTGIAAFLIIVLAIKYDLLVTDLCYDTSSGTTA